MKVSASSLNIYPDPLFDQDLHFSLKTGSLVSADQTLFSLKPKCFEYIVEADPFEILSRMRKDAETVDSPNGKLVSKLSSEFRQKRRELIGLIQKKTAVFKYKLKTFYFAVSLLDRLILTEIFRSLEGEAVALVCLLLAGKLKIKSVKFDEDDAIIPDLNDFGFINYKNFYTVDDLRQYEVTCLRLLDYNLKLNSPFNFLYFLCLNGIIFSDEVTLDQKGTYVLQCLLKENNLFTNNKLQGVDKLYRLCFDILEVIISNSNYINFSPFKIACSIVSLVRELYGLKSWSTRLESLYHIYFDTDLQKCFEYVRSVFLSKTESRSLDRIPAPANPPSSEKVNKTVIAKENADIEKGSAISSSKYKESVKENRKQVNHHRNNNDASISSTIMAKNTVETSYSKGSFIKNLKNQLKNIEFLKSVDNGNSQLKKTVKKNEKKMKYFSEVCQDKLKGKYSLSIKTNNLHTNNPITTVKSNKPSFLSKDFSTIAPYNPLLQSTITTTSQNSISKSNFISGSRNSASKDKRISTSNAKRFVKSQIFIENFKNLNDKSFLKGSSKKTNQISLCSGNFNSNSLEKFSYETASNQVVNSTKSNSFASSFSNNITFSNSLKHLNLKAQFSSTNTAESTLSNSSFIQTKDLKTKFSGNNLAEKAKASSTCNVVISLNTNKVRRIENKKVLLVEGKNRYINKVGFKK